MARVFVILLVGLSAVGASAKTKVLLFPVVPLPGEAELQPAAQMTKAVMTELERSSAIEAVVGEEPAKAVTVPDSTRRPARSDADYRSALAQLKDGANQAQKLRFPQAIRELRRGIDGLTRNIDLLDDYNQLIDAYVLLAVSYFRRGKQPAGVDVLETLARLRPEYVLEEGRYPPVFVSAHNDARSRALARRRGALRVTSAPEGADVWLNGRRLGSTPLVVEEVIPGDHHLAVRLGDGVFGQVVTVREGETLERHADLGAGGPQAGVTLGDAIAANRFDREVRKTARAAAKAAGAEYVLVAAMGMGKAMFVVQAYLGQAKSGRWAALSPLSPDLDMLSDSIEAHTLVRELTAQVSNFTGDLSEDDRPFVADRPARSGKRGSGLKEARVAFVGEGLAVAGGAGERVPVGVGARTPVQPTERAPAVAPPAALVPPPVAVTAAADEGGGRAPVGARRPVSAPPPAAAPPAEPPRAPLSRATAGPREAPPAKVEPAKVEPPKPAAGPVVAASPGIERPDEPKSSEELIAATSTAAVAPDEAGLGPLSRPDLRAEAEATRGGEWWKEWWVWAAVGGAVLVAGGTTAFLLMRDQEPDSVTIRAVW